MINQKTLKKVQDAVHSMGYAPDATARALRRQTNDLVGIVVPDILNPFFARVVKGAEAVLYREGFTVIICDSEEDSRKESAYLRVLYERRIDGLILIPSIEQGQSPGMITTMRIPTVFVDRYFDSSFDSIKGNNYHALTLLVSDFVQRGYTDIGFISGPLNTLPGRERYEGFKRALLQYGLELDDSKIRFADFSIEGGYHAMLDMIEGGSLPRAIIGANNFTTVGLLRALRQKGIDIPGQIIVSGIDELFYDDLIDPYLSLAIQPAADMGRTAAELLIARVRGATSDRPREMVFEFTMVRGREANSFSAVGSENSRNATF
jgi:DNA-binding LacI/PurR family transcriptional regulator